MHDAHHIWTIRFPKWAERKDCRNWNIISMDYKNRAAGQNFQRLWGIRSVSTPDKYLVWSDVDSERKWAIRNNGIQHNFCVIFFFDNQHVPLGRSNRRLLESNPRSNRWATTRGQIFVQLAKQKHWFPSLKPKDNRVVQNAHVQWAQWVWQQRSIAQWVRIAISFYFYFLNKIRPQFWTRDFS